MATKKGTKTNFFQPTLLLLFLNPVSGINIPDPQHCICPVSNVADPDQVLGRAHKPVIADSYHCEEELNPDQHLGKNVDPDPR
jgi:hypothetical protein